MTLLTLCFASSSQRTAALIFVIMFALLFVLLVVTAVNGFHLSSTARSQRSSSLMMAGSTPLTTGAKRVEVASGSSMLAATKKLGLKVPLSCKKGDCGVCTVTVGGKKIRSCIGKVPDAPKLKSLQEKGLPVSVDNA